MKSLCVILCLAAFVGCSRNQPIDRVAWPVMGTTAAVQARGKAVDPRILSEVKEAFGRIVDEFDAHDPKSAINRLGRCTDFGQPCWDFAFRLKAETQGAFDPNWRGTNRLDFGAVAKGFAVDVAAENVARNAKGGGDVLIDLGGNLKAVRGDWSVGVKDGTSFTLPAGAACATSGEYYRGKHIRDARTGRAVTNDVFSVTVIHPSSAMIADGLSTALFVLGRREGELFLKAHYPEAKALWVMKE